MVNKHTRVISQRGQYSGYDVSYIHTRIWKHELAYLGAWVKIEIIIENHDC